LAPMTEKKKSSHLSDERVATIRDVLERLYTKYNHRRLVKPDPLQFLYRYCEPEDVEIVALLASGLAYGRVQQIEKSLSRLFEHMGDSPCTFVREFDLRKRTKLKDFKHRFTAGDDISDLLELLRSVYERFGSIEQFFLQGLDAGDTNIIPALTKAQVFAAQPGQGKCVQAAESFPALDGQG